MADFLPFLYTSELPFCIYILASSHTIPMPIYAHRFSIISPLLCGGPPSPTRLPFVPSVNSSSQIYLLPVAWDGCDPPLLQRNVFGNVLVLHQRLNLQS